MPAIRPATIDDTVGTGLLRPSATGRYIYAVAVWLDGGRTRRQIVRTPDLGASWCLVATAEPIAQVLPAPTREAVVYAVTAAADTSERRLLRTDDGGASWRAGSGALPGEASVAGPQSFVVGADPDVVWFAGEVELHFTRDGGMTWTTLASPEAGAQLFVDPAQPQHLLIPSTGESALLVSRDWGARWTTIPVPEFTSCGGNWPFACGLSMDSSGVLWRGNAIVGGTGDVTSVDVWRSSDWGYTWSQLTNVPAVLDGVPSSLGSHVTGALFVATAQGTFRSGDAGQHWKLVTPSNFWSLTAATGHALIGRGESGLVATTDGGQNWQPLPLAPIPTSLAVSPAAPYPLWAGPGPLRSDDAGVTWRASPTGYPRVIVDGADADVAYATSDSGGVMMRTEDGGVSWEALPSPTGRPVSALGVCPAPLSCLFVLDPTEDEAVMVRSDDHGRTWRTPTAWTNWDTRTPVIVSPEDPDHLLQGRSDAVYETHDGGQTWNYHKLGYAVVGIAFLSDMDVVGISDRWRIVRSSDGGISWALASSQPLPVPPAGNFTVRLVQSTRRPNVLFVLSSDDTQALFRSDDAGETWTSLPALGDQLPDDLFGHASVSDVVDLGQSFLAIVPNYGLVSFE